MNVSFLKNKETLALVAVLSAVVIFLFQNCAKNPNLSQPAAQSATSASTSPNAGSTPAQAAASVTIDPATPSTISVTQGGTFSITYNFSSTGPLSSNLAVLVDILDAGGTTAFQADHNPSQPTTQWNGQVVDSQSVTIPSNLAAGSYTIWAGLYDPTTNVNLSLTPGAGVTPDAQLRYEVGTLTVSLPIGLPVVTVGPSNLSATEFNGAYYVGSASPPNQAMFSVQATGSNLSYQWYFDPVNGSGFTPISGATGPSYSFTVDSLTQAGTYLVQITNSAGNMSAEAHLTITAVNVPIF